MEKCQICGVNDAVYEGIICECKRLQDEADPGYFTGSDEVDTE